MSVLFSLLAALATTAPGAPPPAQTPLAQTPLAQTPPAKTAPQAAQAVGAATGAILQADGARAAALLAALPEAQLSAKDRTYRACALSRLTTPPPPATVVSPLTHAPDPFASRALTLYRAYWQASLADPARRAEAEARLLKALAALLDRPSLAAMDEAETLLDARLAQGGFHALEGKTGQLRELMLWTKQTESTERVALPEETNATRVVYLDDFVSQGWSNYFTCERSGTGGWTKPDGLFVIVPSYDSLTDENFRVNFLAHESQHYADHRRFPDLKPWELEYRAKLVEVAYAVQTRGRVLSGFANNQGDDPADAHSYANKRVLAALRSRLGLAPDADLSTAPPAALQAAAIAELKADSARRAAPRA